MNAETNYRELSVLSAEPKNSFGIDPETVNKLLKKSTKEKVTVTLPFPKLNSLLFWQQRLKREIQKIKREYISTKIENKYDFIHRFCIRSKKIPIITLYALFEFRKAGWNVEISNGTTPRAYINDFSSLEEIYNKFGKSSSLFIFLSCQ